MGELPHPLQPEQQDSELLDRDFSSLVLDTENEIFPYTIINGITYGCFRYRSTVINDHGETAEVHFVDDIERAGFVRPSSIQTHPTYSLTVVQSTHELIYAQLFALRTVIAAGVTRLRIVVHCSYATPEDIKQLVKTDWINVHVVVVRPVENLDLAKLPFSRWVKKHRLTVFKSAQQTESRQEPVKPAQPPTPRRIAITPEQINLSKMQARAELKSQNARKTATGYTRKYNAPYLNKKKR